MSWRELAACRGSDPALFFPGRGGDVRPAKTICASCQVRRECLEDALAAGEHLGVWGGTSEQERRRIRRNPDSDLVVHVRIGRGPAPQPIRHGTRRGYQKHLERDEVACAECRLAHALYRQEYRARKNGSAA